MNGALFPSMPVAPSPTHLPRRMRGVSPSEIRRLVNTPKSAAQATRGRPLQSPIDDRSAEASPSRHWTEHPPISPAGEDSPAGDTAGAFPRSTEIPRRFDREKARNVPARGAMTRFEAGDVVRKAAQGGDGGRRWNGWLMGLVAVLLAGVLACRLGSTCGEHLSKTPLSPGVLSSEAFPSRVVLCFLWVGAWREVRFLRPVYVECCFTVYRPVFFLSSSFQTPKKWLPFVFLKMV